MVRPKHFKLYARCVPPLEAGDYRLTAKQELRGGDAIRDEDGNLVAQENGVTYGTEDSITHVHVKAPRFTLPPDQILSTYPPANAQGSFETRLPQIALKRKTLPWERTVDANADPDRELPWLALVVFADGEAEFMHDQPVDAYAPPSGGAGSMRQNDVSKGTFLKILPSMVNKIFPTRGELPLLAHVREVNINDTELAMGDDDGLYSIILANRLPQYDRANDAPVRYTACLVNLEGKLGDLPHRAEPTDCFSPGFVATVHFGKTVRIPVDTAPLIPALGVSMEHRAGSKDGISPGDRIDAGYEAAHTDVPDPGVPQPFTGMVPMPAAHHIHFPVLAYWSFTCTGSGSFRTLMQGLDVGLLGTVPKQEGAAPLPRPAPETTVTGHVGLPYLTRYGERVRALYRGPMTPHLMERDTTDNGHLPLAHVSDHLRQFIAETREDLSLASGFEIGRLLALSQPSVVAALMRWRREHFGKKRCARIADMALRGIQLFKAVELIPENLGRLLTAQYIRTMAMDPPLKPALARDRVDPGRQPAEFKNLEPKVLFSILSTGLDMPFDSIEQTSITGNMSHISEQQVPVADGAESIATEVAWHLRNRLAAETSDFLNRAQSRSKTDWIDDTIQDAEELQRERHKR